MFYIKIMSEIWILCSYFERAKQIFNPLVFEKLSLIKSFTILMKFYMLFGMTLGYIPLHFQLSAVIVVVSSTKNAGFANL